MKPPSFNYLAPTILDEALAHRADYGDEAKLLAGGQSLIPTLNFRLAQPTLLIDLNPIADLNYIRPTPDGGVVVGTMTRQRQVEINPHIAARAPLVHQTMPYIAHVQIRNRGTFGGNLAHGDPASELPAVALALNARFQAQSRAGGTRWIAAREFYYGLFANALRPDEILTAVELPPVPPRTGTAIHEMARRHGDYALVGVVAVVTLTEGGQCQDASIAFLSVGDAPVLAHKAMAVLAGQALTDKTITAAAETAATQDIDPESDIHATAAFRRHLATVLTRRVLTEATQRAQKSL